MPPWLSVQIGQTAVFSADDRMIGGAPPWDFYKLYRNPAKQFLNIIAISGENVKLVKIGAIFLTDLWKSSKAAELRGFFDTSPQILHIPANRNRKIFCDGIQNAQIVQTV